MNTKSKIQAFFNSDQDDAKYIQKYEETKNFFNNLLTKGHKEDIEFVIPIKLYNYAQPLYKTGQYQKALKILGEVRNDLYKLEGKSEWYNQYLEGVTFLSGTCLSRLKKYGSSNKEFKKLLRKNPDNENFIEWFKSNMKNEITRLSVYISMLGIAYYFIVLFLESKGLIIDNFIVRILGPTIAFIAFVGSYIWKGIIDKQKIKFD